METVKSERTNQKMPGSLGEGFTIELEESYFKTMEYTITGTVREVNTDEGIIVLDVFGEGQLMQTSDEITVNLDNEAYSCCVDLIVSYGNQRYEVHLTII